MSIDVIDDLEAYEAMCGTLAAALRDTTGGSAMLERKQRALAEWDAFCRPTCEDGDCDGIGCGCPHHDGEEEQ